MTDLRRPTLWMLVLLAVALWFGAYFRRGLWEPDEARYAYVAREMHQNGDWFVMHLHGEPYPDKPPLMFWLMNIATVFTGGEINGFSARLPSFLGALLALWATARLMERWCDAAAAAAWRAVAVLGTTYLFFWQGAWGQIDMLLCGLEMMSLWCFFTASDPGKGRRFIGAYLFAGLAVLAKGPVGLLVPVAVYVGVTWAAGEARLLKRGHWLWGTLLACAIPGLWLWLAWRERPPVEYFDAMFGKKSFARALEGDHAQPFYYFVPHFIGEFLPWTIFLPAAWRGLGPGPNRRRFVAWALIVIGLFSLFHTKRNLYTLAAWPGAAMLVAAGWEGIPGLARNWQRVTGWLAVGLVVLIGMVETAVMLGLLTGQVHHAERIIGHNAAAPWMLLPGAALMMAGGALLAHGFLREGLSRRWFRQFAGVMFVHWALVGALVLPATNGVKAPLEFAAEARAKLRPDQPIYVYQKQLAIMALYAERPGRYLRTEDEVAAVIEQGDYGIIVFDDVDWEPMAARFAGRVRVRHFLMGSKDLVWVDFPPPVDAVPDEPPR